MTSNPYTQSIETKLYFVVFLLFAALITLMIYRSFLDTNATTNADSVQSSKNAGIFKPHNQDSAGPEQLPSDSLGE
ncbi:MAG: hypothetical protein HYT39_03120 [Candidatus Sungbacteria bacterium]|nr:hypothetical protein [Candidatus Sungbacteria bacterium]